MKKQMSGNGIITILVISSLTIMVGTVIAPSLSKIALHLNFKYSPGLLITLPSLGVVVFAPLIGRIINHIGAFKLLCFSLIPYALLGFSGAYINNDIILICNRFLLGATTVAIQVAVSSMIAHNFTGEKRIKIIAWQGMAIEIGGVVFLTLGGILGQWNWRLPFTIYLLGFIFIILVFLFLPNKKVIHKTKTNTNDLSTKNKMVWPIFIGSLFSMILFFVSFVRLPQYLPQEFNFTESDTGYLMGFISLIAVLSASQMPKVTKRISDSSTVSLGFALFMLGYICFYFASQISLLTIGVLFIGTGFGFTVPLLNHMMIENSKPQNIGKNLGLYSMGIFGGQFLSTFIGLVSDNNRTLFLTAAVLAGLVSLSLLLLFSYYKNTLKTSKI